MDSGFEIVKSKLKLHNLSAQEAKEAFKISPVIFRNFSKEPLIRHFVLRSTQGGDPANREAQTSVEILTLHTNQLKVYLITEDEIKAIHSQEYPIDEHKDLLNILSYFYHTRTDELTFHYDNMGISQNYLSIKIDRDPFFVHPVQAKKLGGPRIRKFTYLQLPQVRLSLKNSVIYKKQSSDPKSFGLLDPRIGIKRLIDWTPLVKKAIANRRWYQEKLGVLFQKKKVRTRCKTISQMGPISSFSNYKNMGIVSIHNAFMLKIALFNFRLRKVVKQRYLSSVDLGAVCKSRFGGSKYVAIRDRFYCLENDTLILDIIIADSQGPAFPIRIRLKNFLSIKTPFIPNEPDSLDKDFHELVPGCSIREGLPEFEFNGNSGRYRGSSIHHEFPELGVFRYLCFEKHLKNLLDTLEKRPEAVDSESDSEYSKSQFSTNDILDCVSLGSKTTLVVTQNTFLLYNNHERKICSIYSFVQNFSISMLQSFKAHRSILAGLVKVIQTDGTTTYKLCVIDLQKHSNIKYFNLNDLMNRKFEYVESLVLVNNTIYISIRLSISEDPDSIKLAFFSLHKSLEQGIQGFFCASFNKLLKRGRNHVFLAEPKSMKWGMIRQTNMGKKITVFDSQGFQENSFIVASPTDKVINYRDGVMVLMRIREMRKTRFAFFEFSDNFKQLLVRKLLNLRYENDLSFGSWKSLSLFSVHGNNLFDKPFLIKLSPDWNTVYMSVLNGLDDSSGISQIDEYSVLGTRYLLIRGTQQAAGKRTVKGNRIGYWILDLAKSLLFEIKLNEGKQFFTGMDKGYFAVDHNRLVFICADLNSGQVGTVLVKLGD